MHTNIDAHTHTPGSERWDLNSSRLAESLPCSLPGPLNVGLLGGTEQLKRNLSHSLHPWTWEHPLHRSLFLSKTVILTKCAVSNPGHPSHCPVHAELLCSLYRYSVLRDCALVYRSVPLWCPFRFFPKWKLQFTSFTSAGRCGTFSMSGSWMWLKHISRNWLKYGASLWVFFNSVLEFFYFNLYYFIF